MRSKVYGWDGYRHGHVLASVTLSSHRQARLLQRALEREMRVVAGRPEEKVFADMFNEIEQLRATARRQKWVGWEAPL